MMDFRSDSHSRSRSSKRHVDLPTKTGERPHAKSRTVKPSAACRGLYAAPKRRTSEQARSDDKNDDDSIVKHSMYPQMNGRRWSELEAEAEARARTRSTKYDQTSRGNQHYEDKARVGRPVRRPQPLTRVPSHSVASSSDSSSGSRLTWSPTSRAFTRSSLPGDEHQGLVRRQKMQRARELLEEHFNHHGSVRGGRIWHGMKQGFTVRNSERRRLSKMHYAVRKALQADLDLNDDNFKVAMYHRSDKVYFCELSDVDGLPIDEQMVYEFLQLYQKARDTAVKANLLAPPRSNTVQRSWLDERNHRVRQAALALQRVNNDVAMEAPVTRPQLVSKFSWDSNDGKVNSRKRKTKTKR